MVEVRDISSGKALTASDDVDAFICYTVNVETIARSLSCLRYNPNAYLNVRPMYYY